MAIWRQWARATARQADSEEAWRACGDGVRLSGALEGMGARAAGLQKDDVVGPKAIELLQQYQKSPFFFFVHFVFVKYITLPLFL